MNSTSSPRILHISTAKTWRGGEQQLAYLYEELSQLGLTQKIACTQESELSHYCQRHQLNFSTFAKSSGLDFRAMRQIHRTIKEFSPDIVHVHDSHSHSFMVLCSLLFFMRIPIVVSRRVDFPIKNHFFSKYKYNHRLIKKIICVSGAIEKILSPAIPHPQKLITIHDGIDLNKFDEQRNQTILRDEFKLDKNTFIIGTVAALVDHKDLFNFINMAKFLLDKGLLAKFFIVGEGELRKCLMQYTNDLGLENNVIFTGFRHDLKAILPEFNLFVMSSKEEGLGSSILDAMICEVPVVATRAGGIPEIVKHNETGLLAPIKNPQQLADAVWDLISNPSLKETLIRQAKQAVSNFDKKIMAMKTKEVYLEYYVN